MLDFENLTTIAEANRRWSETESYQAALANKYAKYHRWYAPVADDQWPEDGHQRPGKIHITTNVLKPLVDVEARLESKLPRLSLVPPNLSPEERARAELCEKLHATWLDASGWESWLHTLNRTRKIYGKGVLRVEWNKAERRPDVTVIENPANLRIGWGASDFSVIDWTLFEYSLSPQEVMNRWPDLMVIPSKGEDPLQVIHRSTGTHDDPLNQRQTSTVDTHGDTNYQPSDYEKKQVLVWDYWYKRPGKKPGEPEVYNCIIVQRRTHAVAPQHHRELIDIPYIVIENDHEPGSPEGLSTLAPMIDLQIEMNRGLSHWAQLIADEIDPAWWYKGTSYDPAGLVPKGGEITPLGEDGEVGAFDKSINTFPIEQLHGAFWNQFHRTSGIPEVAFGNPGGSQVSGRALAVQIEGAINRIDPRRQLLYEGLRQLLIFWTVMIERLDPKVDTGEGKVGMAKIVKNMRRWKIIAPEITPRDVAEHTTNTINKVNSKLIALKTGMDEIGVDSPEDEIKLIGEERSTLNLFPGDVQVILAVYQAMQQLGINAEMLAQAGGGPNGANDRTGAGTMAADQQRAEPTLGEGDNQGGQPATAPGGIPAGGSLQQTTLVRSNADQQSQALNQLALNRKL